MTDGAANPVPDIEEFNDFLLQVIWLNENIKLIFFARLEFSREWGN